MKHIDQVGQQVLAIFTEIWPAVLVSGYTGCPSVSLHVQDGRLSIIKANLTIGRPQSNQRTGQLEAEGAVADCLESLLPQILVPKFFGSATLTVSVVSGIVVDCTGSIERIHKPAATALAG